MGKGGAGRLARESARRTVGNSEIHRGHEGRECLLQPGHEVASGRASPGPVSDRAPGRRHQIPPPLPRSPSPIPECVSCLFFLSKVILALEGRGCLPSGSVLLWTESAGGGGEGWRGAPPPPLGQRTANLCPGKGQLGPVLETFYSTWYPGLVRNP